MEKYKSPHYTKCPEMQKAVYENVKIDKSKHSSADICFICDITGSMDMHIGTIKKIILSFVSKTKSAINSHPRIAFIGFRDKKDKEQLKVKNFTKDANEIVELLDSIECYGGDDRCEDLVAPLLKALTLNWSSDLLCVYLLVDAPTHGRSYHKETEGDDFPEEDKEKLLEKLVYHYRKKKIQLNVIKCNDSVDIMIEKMKLYYNTPTSELKVISVSHDDIIKEEFHKSLLLTLSNNFIETATSTRYKNFRKIRKVRESISHIYLRASFFMPQEFEGELYTGSITGLDFEKKCFSYKLNLRNSRTVKCKISSSLIGTGTFAECYELEVDGDKSYIAKLPKYKVSDITKFKIDITINLFTQIFTKEFNTYLQQSEKKLEPHKEIRVEIIPLVIIKNITPEKHKNVKIFTAQTLLDGDYQKFNNNYGWVNNNDNSSNQLAQAFSHFTYEYSMGTMIVVDIQGITNDKGGLYITDPVIHSAKYKMEFGETNHGHIGVMMFFKTHNCNDYCRKLRLVDSNVVEVQKGMSDGFGPSIKKWQQSLKMFNPMFDPDIKIHKENKDNLHKNPFDIKGKL